MPCDIASLFLSRPPISFSDQRFAQKPPNLTTDNTDDTDLHGSKKFNSTILNLQIRVLRVHPCRDLLFCAKHLKFIRGDFAFPIARSPDHGVPGPRRFLRGLGWDVPIARSSSSPSLPSPSGPGQRRSFRRKSKAPWRPWDAGRWKAVRDGGWSGFAKESES